MIKGPDPRALRIMDANMNRSREGLRVCEDIARFVFDEAGLTRDLKKVRHAISDIVRDSYARTPAIIEARNTSGDVGKESFSATEMERIDYVDIFRANIQRVKESLRVLEEMFKLFDLRHVRTMARLRFKVYDIEKRSFKKISPLSNR